MLLGFHGLKALAAIAVTVALSSDSALRSLAAFNHVFPSVDLFFLVGGFVLARAWRGQDPAIASPAAAGRPGGSGGAARVALSMLALLLAPMALAAGLRPLATQAPDFDAEPLLTGALGWAGLAMNLPMLAGAERLDGGPLIRAVGSLPLGLWLLALLVVLGAGSLSRNVRLAAGSALAAAGACGLYFSGWQALPGAPGDGMPIDRLLMRTLIDAGIGAFALEACRRWLAALGDRSIALGQALVVPAIVAALAIQALQPFSPLWSLPLLGALLFLIGDGRGWLGQALGSPAMVWLGERGLAICITHQLAAVAGRLLPDYGLLAASPMLAALVFLPYLVVVLAFAHWLHATIEVPLTLWLKAWLRGRRQPMAPV